jgi:DNA-binding response OmpR family regulator
MKLLIAEDDVFFQELLKQILTPDHELVLAHDGNEAWAALQLPNAPRLAILDWVMPALSGPQVCRKVRACAALSSTYLIILTAKNNEADIVSGLRAGADDYLTKPPIPAELRARVRVGERILALHDAVEAQSSLANQASGRERLLRESLADCAARQGIPSEEHLRGIDSSPRQHRELGYCRLNACGEIDRSVDLQLTASGENRHPHR